MATVSHETKQMKKAAAQLKDFDFVETVTTHIGDNPLPVMFWPVISQIIIALRSGMSSGDFDGAAGAYKELYELTYQACESLNELCGALGVVLHDIATDYEKQEEQYGTEFTYLDD